MSSQKLTLSEKDCKDLLNAAVAWGKQAKWWQPKWLFMLRIPGALKWLLTFKTAGSAAALEPVYAFAKASADLIPQDIKDTFVQLTPQMNTLIRHTVFGEVYGERFCYIENFVENLPDDVDLLASLGSGRALPELIGLQRRQKAGKPMPKLLLVDASKKCIEGAHLYGRMLGIAPELITSEVCRITSDYRVSTAPRNVVVGSWGLAGNYFPTETLRLFILSLAMQPNVAMLSTDFVSPVLCDMLHNAIGWPVAVTPSDAKGFVKVKPRDLHSINRLCSRSWRRTYKVDSIAREQMHLLTMTMTRDYAE